MFKSVVEFTLSLSKGIAFVSAVTIPKQLSDSIQENPSTETKQHPQSQEMPARVLLFYLSEVRE